MRKLVLRVSGPAGAVFEPEFYNIDLDNSKANCEDSFSFKLVGFGIESKVVINSKGSHKPFRCDNSDECELTISLTSTESKQQVASTTTNADGSFKFPKVAPGSYRLQVQPKAGIAFSHPAVECEIRLGAASDCNSAILEISGFELKGRAESYEEPLEGVAVALVERESGRMIQHTITDSKGEYKFFNVAPGRYFLNATVSDTGAKYKIDKPLMEAEVKDKITVVSTPFIVAGLSIRGKVTRHGGQGIGGVEVKIDGKTETTTNEFGSYKLDEIVPGDYILEGLHDDYLFEPMRITIEPHSSKIPDLVVSEYKLCGKIIIKDNDFNTDRRSVTLKDKQGHQERITSVDKDGVFCFDVKPLKYVVIPVITSEEYERGLRFYPSKLDVEIQNEPATNLKFEQVKYTLNTAINCKHKGHCDGLEITLQSTDSDFSKTVSYKGEQHKFDNLLPGTYTVQVNQPEF